MKNSSTKEKVTWAVISVLVLLYALFPVASILATSFKQPSDLTTGKFLPTEWSTVNYEQILVGDARAVWWFRALPRGPRDCCGTWGPPGCGP